jgi:hypothetical protein
MKCHIIDNGFVCEDNNMFFCPYCNEPYTDDNDYFFKRISKNKSCVTTHKCQCGNKFDIAVDYMGNYHGCKR